MNNFTIEKGRLNYDSAEYQDKILQKDGGAGSGNWGHAGRPGKKGGSAGGSSSPHDKAISNMRQTAAGYVGDMKKEAGKLSPNEYSELKSAMYDDYKHYMAVGLVDETDFENIVDEAFYGKSKSSSKGSEAEKKEQSTPVKESSKSEWKTSNGKEMSQSMKETASQNVLSVLYRNIDDYDYANYKAMEYGLKPEHITYLNTEGKKGKWDNSIMDVCHSIMLEYGSDNDWEKTGWNYFSNGDE